MDTETPRRDLPSLVASYGAGVLSSDSASVLELGVVLPEVALMLAVAFGVALAQSVGASQLPVLPHLPRLNQTLCVHLLCSCLAPAPVLMVFKC